MSFDARGEILTSLQANPDGLGARKAIPPAVEKAPIACDHADDLINRRSDNLISYFRQTG
jgi:hypothetical protein